MPKEYRTTGETLTPLGVQLQQRNASGVLADVDLTGKTVKVVVVNEYGTTVVDETTTGVTVTDATTGQVSYSIPSTVTGNNLVYFHVYGTGGDSAKYDIYPTSQPESNRMQVVVSAKV